MQLSSQKEYQKQKQSCIPKVRLESSKVITPVGGLLSQLPPETHKERQEKIKVNNKKMSELLYLPAYLLPKASDYARNILSVLSENAKLEETGPKIEPEVKADVTVDEEMDETEGNRAEN